jgi:Kef-type K+ transport system membrane component KefB
MKLSPSIFKSQWALWFGMSFIVAGILSKWILTWSILKSRADLHPEVVAWGMVPRGIPGFAFATASVSAGLINNEIFTLLILVVSVTTWVGLIGIEYSARKKKLSSV